MLIDSGSAVPIVARTVFREDSTDDIVSSVFGLRGGLSFVALQVNRAKRRIETNIYTQARGYGLNT